MPRRYTTPALAALGAIALAAPVKMTLPAPGTRLAIPPVFEVNDACAAVGGMTSCRPRTNWMCITQGYTFNNYCDTADAGCNS
jgi:hypothetical protein